MGLSTGDFAKIEQIFESSSQLEFINNLLPGGVVVCETDEFFTILYANDGFYDLLGYTKDEFDAIYKGKGCYTIHAVDKDGFLSDFRQAIQDDTPFCTHIKLFHKTNGHFHAHFSSKTYRMIDGTKRAFIVITDISAQIHLLESYESEQSFNNIILELANDSFFDHDITLGKIRFSKNFEERFDIAQFTNKYPRILEEDGSLSEERMPRDFNKCNFDGQVGETELSLIDKEGIEVWYNCVFKIFLDNNHVPTRALGKLTDITRQKMQVSELTRLAQTDLLTGLLNKDATETAIKEVLLKYAQSGEKGALFIMDIDNFKGVNDNLGHQFGDAVLSSLATQIKGLFRESDIVGRIGGDEFMVFMQGVKKEDRVLEKAMELCKVFKHTYPGEDVEYRISGSVGVAFYPRHGNSFDELYSLGDEALYQSKNRGKDCYTVCSATDAIVDKGDISPFVEAERFVANFFSDDLVYKIFEMLYETKDLPTTINMILSILGEKFDVSRVYIF